MNPCHRRLIAFCTILSIGFTSHFVLAQDKVYMGMSSGLSVGYINMGQTTGPGFRNVFTYALAPTGVSISREYKKKWMLEGGAYVQTFVNRGYGLAQEYAPGRWYVQKQFDGTDAFAFSFKMLRFHHRDRKIISAPHVGFTFCAVNQLNSIKENFQTQSTGSITTNGITSYDTLYSSTLFTTNNFLGIDLGWRTWLKLGQNSFLTFDVNYFVNPGAALSFQSFTYVKDNEPSISGFSVHRARNIYLQLGYRWHWKDLHKPQAD